MRALFLSYFILVFAFTSMPAQKVDMDIFHGIEPRNIGPAGMSGRITAIDVVLDDTDHIYIGAAAGGVWESENNGHTWTPIFDDQKASSIGDIAIFQANPAIIYVATGEGNPRNSQNSGRGIFKSMDGGKTWTHLGLDNTRQIHRVIIHPDNSDIVWAGVSGASWGDSEERGVYKTIDGGHTWKKILYIDDHTGVSDLVMDPSNPNKLIVGMWEHRRKPWNFVSGGPSSGMYITHDGGENWKELTDKDGLPRGDLGRIGLSFAPSQSSIVYAYIENKSNAIFRSEDGGLNWKQVSKNGDSKIGTRPFYYADIYVDTKNENRVYSIASEVTVSDDGGKTWSTFAPGNKIHTDHHAWWSHPEDADHIMIGHDGGLNTTFDRGENWGFADNLPLAQFYHIRVDNEFPFHVMGGLQDNGSWRGPNRTWFKGGIRNMYWQRLSVGDGFDVVPDPQEPDFGYAMGQTGNLVRYHIPSGQLKKIKPSHPEGDHLRFNWNAGIAINPIDKTTMYYGSQYLHRSSDKGKSWKIISPDLTTNDPHKTKFLETGGLTYDATGAENHCAIISIDPSPLNEGVIWVGTDDGNIQVTQNEGVTWNNVIDNIRGVPSNTWVTQITASTHDAGSAVVVFDDHRRNNWEPYVFRTSDYGRTWNRVVDAQDVDGYVYCFTQDALVPELQFVGTEFGLYVSFDNGENWNKWTEGLPTMPVSDLVIHPREHDLVIGTFGRAIWVMDDIRPLREMSKESISNIKNKKLHLFPIPDEHLMIIGESIGYRQGKIGDALYNGENRKYGALLTYWYDGDTEKEAKIEIRNADEAIVRTIYHKTSRGVNRANWRTNIDAPRDAKEKKSDEPYKPKGGFFASPGDYHVTISIDSFSTRLWMKLSSDPRIEISSDEIKDKSDQISAYNNEAIRVTALSDDVREFLDMVGLKKDIVKHTKPMDQDSLTQLIDSVETQVLEFQATILEKKDVQGIYRDPQVLYVQLRIIGYAIDHPLSPVTPNQEIQLTQLRIAIDKKDNEWNTLKGTLTQDLKNQIPPSVLKIW
ncbi:MAG: photosystem II stability/assembly factor-like uncharacterized protein [Saprospiraceae bacterium]|jgi:photosystem II stability/assembly factor-like uncharacterized protein